MNEPEITKEPPSFQGQKNIYVCRDCGYQMITIDRDEGTTPFTTACIRSCKAKNAGLYRDKGTMESRFYNPRFIPPNEKPTHEWYRPDDREIRDIRNPNILQHVAMGGLMLRRIF